MKASLVPHPINYRFHTAAILLLLFVTACEPTPSSEPVAEAVDTYNAAEDSLRFEGEKHLRNIRQLTFGGNNAEAYWSRDDQQLIFQSDWDQINPQGCDQIYVMNVDGSPMAEGHQYQLASTGKGRTTCSYFMPGGRIIYGSTHATSLECPPPVSVSQGRYVWPIYMYRLILDLNEVSFINFRVFQYFFFA